MQNMNSQTVQLIIVAAVALTMLLQAIVLLAIFTTLRKSAQAMREDIEELRSSVMPILGKVSDLIGSTGPKVEAAAQDLAAMSHNLRRQTADVQATANEVMERLRRQSARMDTMLTGILDAVDRATGFMSDAVTKPMRQLAGLLASAKAIVESLRSEAPPPVEQTRGDKDMFV
jgi:hypothetical protein